MNRNRKIVAGATALLLAAGLGIAAVGTTSAYFSDTNSGGAITASAAALPSIAVDVDGDATATPDIAFDDLLPGEPQEQSFEVTNSGSSAQDVWVQFPNPDEVDHFSDVLKKDADFEIFVDGESVWSSAKAAETQGASWKLPQEIELVTDLQPGESVTVTFEMSLDPAATSDQQASGGLPVTLHYNIVATQPGIDPGQ